MPLGRPPSLSHFIGNYRLYLREGLPDPEAVERILAAVEAV